jgi:hypothetical protein
MPKNLESYHIAWLSAHPERSEEWLRAKIEEGFHVHHKDGDHSNDDPLNLILMDGVDHMRLHGMKLEKPAARRARGKRKPKLGQVLTHPANREFIIRALGGTP